MAPRMGVTSSCFWNGQPVSARVSSPGSLLCLTECRQLRLSQAQALQESQELISAIRDTYCIVRRNPFSQPPWEMLLLSVWLQSWPLATMPTAPPLTAILCCGTKKHLALGSPCLSQDLASYLTQVYTHTQYTYTHIHTRTKYTHTSIYIAHMHVYTCTQSHIKKSHSLSYIYTYITQIYTYTFLHTYIFIYTHSHLFKWLSLLSRQRRTSSDSNLPILHLPLMGSWGCRGQWPLDQCIHTTLRCY